MVPKKPIAVHLLFSFAVAGVMAGEPRGKIFTRDGVVLAETAEGKRSYPLGPLTSHLVGYISKDGRGRDGMEMALNESLTAGDDATLTIDSRIHRIAGDAFPKDQNGAVVVLDPNTGAVLALTSFPAYDPNHFIPIITKEQFNKYLKDPHRPLVNRASHPTPPGSTYMIPVALAASMTDDDKKSFRCDGEFALGAAKLRCWKPKGHGDLNLSGAIKHSCNCYFYQLGTTIGMTPIESTARILGFDEPTNVGLPRENSGLVPTPAKVIERGADWTKADTAITAIGRGRALASPLQLASMAATMASGGKLFQPHLIPLDEPRLRLDLVAHGYPAGHIEMVRKAMWRAINEGDGSASALKSEVVELAGMTATVIAGGRPATPDNSLFVGFAPYKEPTLAICVLTQKTEDAKSAGAIGAEVLTKLLSKLKSN